MIHRFNSKKGVEGHLRDDVQMLEAANTVLTSAWNDNIQGMVQYRIRRSVMLDIQRKIEELFARTEKLLACNLHHRGKTKLRIPYHYELLPDFSNRSIEYNNLAKRSRGPHMRTKIDAHVISKHLERNIIILDVDKQPILSISSHDIRDSIELIYNPPCPAYPGGHFDAYVRGKVKFGRYPTKDNEDCHLLYYAIKVGADDEFNSKYHISKQIVKTFIDEHPSEVTMLITSVNNASQLKRGRALLRLDVTHPTRQCEYVELDSAHLFSCIEQALKSENVSRLAKVLAEYESESRSADTNSPEHGTETMTSHVSRDACILFLPTGNSVEAEVYRPTRR